MSMAGGASSLSTNQRGALMAGAMAAVLSFIPGYIEVTFDGPGFDESYTAWSGSSTIGIVLLLGGTALIGIEAFSGGTLPNVVPWHLIAVLASALGTFLIILRALTAGSSAPGANVGPGWPGLLLFVAAISVTVFSVLSFFDSEDALEFRG
jgi:hypothetical protein